jgi:hypothetical protein
VAEWYCVPELSPVWRAFNRHDESLLRRREGEPKASWFGGPIRDEARGEWWGVPAVYHDIRGWVTDPVLPLLGECCGGWWWGVVLDRTADPRAVITHDEGETWDFCGTSFSAYVYAILFDGVFDSEHGYSRAVRLGDHHLYGRSRQQLREQFRVEPTTRVPFSHRAELTERFSRNDQRVSVSNLETPRCSSWQLWAKSWESFNDLVGRLSHIFPAFTGLTPMNNLPLWIAPGATAVQPDAVRRGESEIPF